MRCMLALLAFLPATIRAQAVDTARVRAAYAAVTALRNQYERDHGHFASVNRIRLHYLEWGPAGGVPLVWAHGSASSAYELRAVAPRLAAAGYRVLSVDYRGHGLTRVTNYEFGIQHIADDLVLLLDHLGIRSAVFGGASKGGFVAAAVHERYPERVLGLLMADGGTWTNQWLFDHHGTEEVRQQLARGEGPPSITGTSEFDVFRQMAGRQIPPTGDIPVERLLDIVTRIGPAGEGKWSFLPGFDKMMGSLQGYYDGATRPSTMPLLQWSQHALIPAIAFRKLAVPMMILDPQEPGDELPVTDQNERLAAQHPEWITHKIYPQSAHAVVAARPDWFVRDATELLERVKSGPVPIGEHAVATLRAPGYADFLALDGEAAWVTNTGRVERLLATRARPVASVAIAEPCGAMAVAFGSLWVADCSKRSVIRVGLMSHKVEAAIATGLADPTGELSIATGAGSVWILSDSTGTLSRIDPTTNRVTARIPVAPGSYAAVFGFGSVWITTTGPNGSVQRIDPKTNRVVATIPVGPVPRFLAAGEGSVWTLNQGDGTVSRIDPSTNALSATIAAGVPGGGGDIATGGGMVWVRATKVLLSVIDPATNRVVRKYGPPAGSGAVRATATHVWVTAHDARTVWVLPIP